MQRLLPDPPTVSARCFHFLLRMAASSPSLMENLMKELECSVCLEIYTDPKTLPCLHTFCRRCLNALAERRENHEPIACPECRTEVALPEGINFDAFPSSFYPNRLRDIVSSQREDHQVLCNSCDRRCAATAFCFDCESFICQKCAIMSHKNHEFVHLTDDAVDRAKFRLNETNKKVRAGVVKLEEKLRINQEASGKMEEEIVVAELSIQRSTQRFIELAKRHEREVMEELAAIREDQERVFDNEKVKLELELGQLRSVTDYLDSVLKRGISGEIFQAEPSVSSRSGELLKTVEELQPVRSECVKYVANEDVYKRVEQLDLGRVTRRRNSARSYEHVCCFGTQGRCDGQFRSPVYIAVSSNGEVAVADHCNHRVQVFSREGQFLRKFGTYGWHHGQFDFPSGLAYDKAGNILVGDRDNARIQVFSPTGQWIRKFGTEVLMRPCGVSVTNDNNTVVCDGEAKKVFVFSPEGRLLLQFDSCLEDQSPTVIFQHAIFHREKFFVSAVERVVRVFDARGAHLYDIGEGHLGIPAGLAIDANDLLLVGDRGKHCVQVFTLDGGFVTSFGSRELSQGSFRVIYGVVVGPNGGVLVCHSSDNCIRVYQPQY